MDRGAVVVVFLAALAIGLGAPSAFAARARSFDPSAHGS
jgi:hypothetical protein